MSEHFSHFGGVDFSGAREPLTNLWSALGVEENGRLRVLSVRPHAYRKDLASYVASGWAKDALADARILWGADFPFGLPDPVCAALGAGRSWRDVLNWVADRPADEIRQSAGDAAKTLRQTDSGGALPPLDLRLYKQTIEGFRWLQELVEESSVCIQPQLKTPDARVTLVEVYPSATAKELGMPRRRAPSRPGEIRARAAALKTYMDFASADCECLVVTLEDAWDAAIACLTAYLCREDLSQPRRAATADLSAIEREGWIYRPPATLG